MSAVPRFPVWLAVLLLLGAVRLAAAQDLQPVPTLTERVTDLTATLSVDERERLSAKLAALEGRQGVQIAVLLVPTAQPEAIEQYALRVAEAWKLGRKGVDDGALLIVAKNDRKLRIEVGYGLEGALNDAVSKRIVSDTITPHFKTGNYYQGIDAGVDAIARVVAGEALPPPAARSGPGDFAAGLDLQTLLFLGFILVFFVGGILRAIFGRLLAAGIIGGAAGVIASLIVSSLFVAGFVGIAAFVVSLVAGRSGFGGVPWMGGGWGGGRGGGFRGGGFRGGGGGFGGGGASGDW